MSYSGPGLTKGNDSDISSFKRLEAKILAEERDLDPNFSTCPACITRLTKHLHHNKHHNINSDGDILSARSDINNNDPNDNENEYDSVFSADSSSSSSPTSSPSHSDVPAHRRWPKRVERHSMSENEEKQRFRGAFR